VPAAGPSAGTWQTRRMSSTSAAELWVVRHGETEWSRDGRHTSTTDLPLTDVGEDAARELAPRLADVEFDLVLTSPRRRARRTAELAGFGDAEVDEDLVEWAYGDYEGVTTAEIRESVPGWTVWTHPTPGGESADEVAARLDRVVARTREHDRALVFAHGHSLRVLTARWLEQSAAEGRFFKLDTSTVSVLGFEREHPALLRWNS
jgi:broad specificity phosphatase PhoE